jgi:hypothetical protein
MVRNTVLTAVVGLFLCPLVMLAGKKQMLPAGSQSAATIEAILRNATLSRTAAQATKADYGSELAWSDTVRTDGNGRVRLRMTGDSLVSIGTNSELVFVRRDGQRTALQLSYGQMRLQPSATESVEVRTPIALVTGTGSDFAVDASMPGRIRVICLEGTVQITNPNSGSPMECEAGEIVTVKAGKAPYQPQEADATTIGLWHNITDPDEQPQVQYFP